MFALSQGLKIFSQYAVAMLAAILLKAMA